MYGGYRASFLVTAAGVAICAVAPNLAIGCVGAVIFGIGNGIGLVCNVTLIQQVVSDDRRGQIFAVLGSLVQTFTLIGMLVAGPVTEAVGPRVMWGISAVLLVLGFVNAVVVSALRNAREPGPHELPVVIRPIEAGGATPGWRVRADRRADGRGRADPGGGGRSGSSGRRRRTGPGAPEAPPP